MKAGVVGLNGRVGVRGQKEGPPGWPKPRHVGGGLAAHRQDGIRPGERIYPEALAALCYGWIDGQKRSLDETAWLQKFTRAASAACNQVNREKAEGHPQRQDETRRSAVERAGSAARKRLHDLPGRAGALIFGRAEANPAAKAFYATLNSQNRYAILFRLQTARKPETRAKRIEQFIIMLEKGEKLYP
jgi:uncharacterized protein YdeI (YjbR/CyaY-like superfamily)